MDAGGKIGAIGEEIAELKAELQGNAVQGIADRLPGNRRGSIPSPFEDFRPW